MSLLTPSPGEIYDRLSIIGLKLESGNQSPHLQKESEALGLRLIKLVAPVTPEQRDTFNREHYAERLAAVNAFIWHKEDEIRAWARGMELPQEINSTLALALAPIARQAIEIRALADRRHYLIAEIDKLFGEDRAGKEKSWMKCE